LSLRELIDVAENAMSSSTYGLLKRGDEAAVIRSAFNRPRFVEDVVRLAAEEVARRWHPQISAKITVRAEAQESIHKHNSFAEITGTIDQIHDQLKVPTHGHVK